ncbi:TRAP transporter permease [Amorphus sp. 3PC139-8]|uniref:TRAP transporter permease n=1 Tax=Amorphus sp. 3PC139-8 TaxID=2735676 RepID=UPI00345D33AD
MAENLPERRLHSGIDRVLRVILVAYAVFQIYTAFFGSLEPLIQRGIFLGLGLGSIFLIIRLRAGGGKHPLLADLASIMLALAGYYVCFHVAFSATRLSDFMVDLTWSDRLLGMAAVVIVLEAARRTIGWFLPLLALLGIGYYLFGHQLIDGTWQPPPVSLLTFIETYYASTETIFGYMVDMGTRVIAIFIILGALLLSTGATEIFIKLATIIAGRSYGGQAKVCTVSSALFGTVTGSAVANVMAMGPVTIPTMRRAGYRGSFAAAIEAVSSAGGQIMPPIMGAGAFIMAEILNIPYSQVMTAAIIPALLYFTVLWFSVGMSARRLDIRPLAASEMPHWRELVDPYTALPMYLPVVSLIALLAMDYTPTLSGSVAVFVLLGTLLVVRSVRCLLEEGPRGLIGTYRTLLGEILEGLYSGGKAIAMVAVLLACAAIVVKVLTATGAGVKISGFILSLSDENLVLVLILTAVLAILLGMDVPTTASYILASAVAGPILINMGIEPLNAHLFIFYFAIMSAITPPVCASVYAAATIAGENFWKVAGHAVVMAIALYLVPFLFIFRTGVLMEGTAFDVIYDTTATGLAVVSITCASAGYLLGRMTWPMRVILYVGGGMLFYPAIWTDTAGLIVFAAVAAMSWLHGSAARHAEAAVDAKEDAR